MSEYLPPIDKSEIQEIINERHYKKLKRRIDDTSDDFHTIPLPFPLQYQHGREQKKKNKRC